MIDIDSIEARAAKATPGPWTSVRDERDHGNGIGVYYLVKMPDGDEAEYGWTVDADFAAHARADVPALCASLREQRLRHAACSDALDFLMVAADAACAGRAPDLPTLAARFDEQRARVAELEAIADAAMAWGDSQANDAVQTLTADLLLSQAIMRFRGKP